MLSGGTHGDFDQRLNKAVHKLRCTLGDDPANPRYIQTLSRNGYRFIASVEFINRNGSSSGIAETRSGDLVLLVPQGENISSTPGNLTPIPTVNSAFNDRPDVPEAHSSAEEPQTNRNPIPSAQLASRLESRGPISRHSTILLSLLGIILTGAAYFTAKVLHTSLALSGPVRIAVLPLNNLTGDPGQDYICDGLTEELIARLGMLNANRLAVIASTTMVHYKPSVEPVQKIRAELAVDYVIEGSVRNVAGHYRVITDLIDTRTETLRWTGNFDRELKDIVDVYRDVSLAVGQEIGIHVLPDFQMPAAGTQPINPEAHDYYLRGLYHLDKRTVADLRDAIDNFDQAITAQPSYAQAYSGLADAYSLLASFGATPYREAYPKARDAALKSLSLDRTAQALTSLAFVEAFYDWRVTKAEEDFRSAIQLNPNYATAHHWYGLFLNLRSRQAEAITELLEASRLDPLSIAIKGDLATAYSDAGHYDEAITEMKKLQLREPDHFVSYRGLAIAYAAQHRFAEAEAANNEFKTRSGSYLGIDYILAYRYVEAGQPDRGGAVIQDMFRQAKLHGDEPPCPLDAYLALGNDDLALRCLSRAIEERGDWIISLPMNPRMAHVKNDPRFRTQLRRAGLISDLSCAWETLWSNR
jgi:TolB-like protein/tetratricopeptide (TPR) repeat protein